VGGDIVYKLLIVEDEPIIRRGILSLVNFKELNIMEVFEASDGKVALDIFNEKLPDLLLADINMPKMNGLELAQACKEIKPEVKICLITGYDYFDYALKALKLGVDDYILKPVSKKDIGELLGKLIKKIELERYKEEITLIVTELKSKSSSSEDEGYKAKIEKEIEINIGNSMLSLSYLSSKMKLSMGYLSSLFKNLFGVSFQEYVFTQRMERAKILLLSTEMKNYEIAESLGFEDANYFSSSFKKKYGMSPNQYKGKVRE
jgi:two-component system, response regulator YesN